ncbi:MAG TPA: twin-arginine translocase TatA/TatE family subunit [Armatimonadetes bacterium]|nr:twin-arginine translocase TatA/TatE family subunit [Armatimonadota bacterium]
MFGVGGPEVIYLLVIALILFGGKQLPKIARAAGQLLRELRSISQDLTQEVTSAFDIEEDVIPRD